MTIRLGATEGSRSQGPSGGPSEGPSPPPPEGSPRGPRLGEPSPRVLVLLAALGVLGLVLYVGRDALPPFVIGLLLAYLLDPPVEWLGRRGFPRPLAILAVYAVALAAVAAGINALLQTLLLQLRGFVDALPDLIARLGEQGRRLSELYRTVALPPEVRQTLDRQLAELATTAATLLPQLVQPVFTSVWAFIGSVVGFAVVPVWVFYLLKDRPRLTAALRAGVPEAWRADLFACLEIATHVLGRWIRGQLVLGFSVGLATYVGLEILAQVVDPIFGRYALLLALVAGLLELLPIIGPIIAAVPAILVAATAGLGQVLAALLLYFVVQQLENAFLVPKIQGDAVRLHPAAVILALIVGSAVAGLLGAILALPLTATGWDIFRYLFRRLSPDPPPPEVVLAAVLRRTIPMDGRERPPVAEAVGSARSPVDERQRPPAAEVVGSRMSPVEERKRPPAPEVVGSASSPPDGRPQEEGGQEGGEDDGQDHRPKERRREDPGRQAQVPHDDPHLPAGNHPHAHGQA
jgi:predicted PurR-regulated permease PerM